MLSKLHTKQNIEAELEMSGLDLTAAESKATYEEIKDYVLEHMGLKASSLYIAQVKQKCGMMLFIVLRFRALSSFFAI